MGLYNCFFLDPEQLFSFLQSLNSEQRNLCSEAATCTLSASRLQYRLLILKRYFVALNRVPYDFEHGLSKKKNQTIVETNTITKCDGDPAIGLARVGSRAALNFSFAFLRRAWRLGRKQFYFCFKI